MTAALHQRIALRDRFRGALADAMRHRDDLRELVDTPDGPEIAWVLFERRTMVDEVNRARAEAGKPPVAPDVVLRAERLAAGHVDYHLKLSFYCAEIVLDEFGTRP